MKNLSMVLTKEQEKAFIELIRLSKSEDINIVIKQSFRTTTEILIIKDSVGEMMEITNESAEVDEIIIGTLKNGLS